MGRFIEFLLPGLAGGPVGETLHRQGRQSCCSGWWSRVVPWDLSFMTSVPSAEGCRSEQRHQTPTRPSDELQFTQGTSET